MRRADEQTRFAPGWMITISALMLAVWLVGVSVVAWRGLGRSTTRVSNRLARIFTGRGHQPDDSEAIPIGPTRLDDPRLSSLRLAADSWQRSAGPRRVVVDQVCLVPDVPAFLEAIALWDERHFFPILIDEPAWTLPFLRAFRPARVVRYAGRAKPGRGGGRYRAHRRRRLVATWCGRKRSRPWLEPGLTHPSRSGCSRPPIGLPGGSARRRLAWF